MPKIWKFSVPENGWTNNQLGFEWLQHFDAHTKARQVGSYRLLIMDGHESHMSQKSKDYCLGKQYHHALYASSFIAHTPATRPGLLLAVKAEVLTTPVRLGASTRLSYQQGGLSSSLQRRAFRRF